MKFGEYLKQNILHPWKIEYIQYDILKHGLKQRQLDREWDDTDEANFIQIFSNERNKVEQFITNFNKQLGSRIKYARHLLKSSVVNFQTNQQQKQAIEFLNTLDDSLVEIIFDVNEFSKFVYLNKLGFCKILKKHKKWTLIDHEGMSCFEYQTVDSALGLNWQTSFYTQVSLLRYQCRHRFSIPESINIDTVVDLTNTIPVTASERKVKKYWISPQNVSEVMAIISMHSYIVQPPVKKSTYTDNEKKFDFAMSNIYFENNDFYAYSNRLIGMENSQGIKCKRYGSDSNDHIYFEHEICNKPYSYEIYSKKRLKMDYDLLSAFYKGEHQINCDSTPTDTEEMDEKEAMKLTEENESSPATFAKEIQSAINSSSSMPIIQCDYQRVLFQTPFDKDYSSPLIITIDTNISFCALNNDSSEKLSFVPVDECGHVRDYFQYAVLEIKFPADIKLDDPSLDWFNSFSKNSNLMYEVPKFSKYLQGVYQLYSLTNKSLVLPGWEEIYIQGISSLGERAYGLSRSRSLRPLLNGEPFRSIVPYSAAGSINKERSIRKSLQQSLPKETKNKPKNKLNYERNSSDFTVISMNNHFMTDDCKLENLNDSKVVLEMNEKTEMNYHQPIKQAKTSTTFFFSKITNKQNNDNKCIIDQDGNPIEYKNQQQHKKKEVVKIEPKAFFANERTFISWLQFCALLLTVALNLLNFGDQTSRVCGGIFLFISMLLALYALFRFQYRAWQLRNPNQTGRYDDLWGPAILCILVVAALVINFCLRFRYITNQENQNLYPEASKLIMNNSTNY